MRRGSKRRLLAAVATAGVLAGAVAACGDSGGSGTSPAGGSDKIINVFTGASGQLTPNFNPFSQTATPGTLGMIFEALFFFNQARADDIQPQLGTEYAFDDGGKTLTFTLRNDVKWSDGQAFTADDVAFTFNLIKDNEKLNTGGLPITEARATDPSHVTLKFSQGIYTRLWTIAGQTWIVPKHLWSGVPDPSAFTNDKNPVGTGPYKLKSFAPQNYVLEKNTGYWEVGKPKVAGFRYQTFSGNESGTAALAAGQLDWTGMFIPDIEKQYVSKDPKNNKYLNESNLYITNLVPNLARQPWDDVAVRQAISYALDREQIIKLAFSGYGKMPGTAALPVPLYQDYIKPEYRDMKLEYDPQKATQTLEQAGYAKGSDGIYAKNGKKLAITCLVVQGYSDYISALQIMTQALKEVGIQFTKKEVSYASFANAQQVGDFDMIITNGYGGPSPYIWYNNLFATKQTAPLGKPAASNYSRYSNPTVDASLATIEQTDPKNTDAIKAEIGKIQDVIVKDFPYIPLQQSSALAEYRTVNVTGFPTEDNHYALALPFGNPDGGIVAKNLVPVG
ncbi:ABC transporter substrate-binding protein [Rhizomonospora bruguierae]|uniref:ABC transporter substrate-binding protein n=1 Tax=Rhizomonospora bruguierae TaxID=1581705 RepID=UPI001BCF2847|nr:ABC transporter substrate-binding protein [Micromonospora sp. NBRC 107566]